MSNPTELLDRLEALRVALKQISGTRFGWGGDCGVTSIADDALSADDEAGRRAQPEGEAPQAEAICKVCNADTAPNGETCGVCFGKRPAAQHADSGALAAIPRELIKRVIERLSKAQIFPLASELRAALAAQSQGAQAVQIVTCKGKGGEYELVGYSNGAGPKRGESIVVYRDVTKPDVFYHRAVDDFRERMEWLGTRAAQQAAAPGALNLLNADELAALRRFDETCQDGEGYDVPKAMMQRLAAIGAVRRTSGSYYETTEFGTRVLDQPAPSAPGTPEAPADLNAQRWLWVQENIRDGYELPGGFYLPDHDTSTWDRTVDAARAAQLDGGQGGSGK